MISYPDLGNQGRLGNQLFQMAATIALALEGEQGHEHERIHGAGYGFPLWEYEQHFPHLKGCFYENILPGPTYTEPTFGYRPIRHQPNLHLSGFFQSEKYFAKHATLIRWLFTSKYLKGQLPRRGTASIHVRRTDYIGKENYHRQLELIPYYRKAVHELEDLFGIKDFLVFSDDPEWCRKAFGSGSPTGVRFSVMDMGPPVEDMAIMSLCEHHIIANSSYSWWGAWLSPNRGKVIYAPKPWFGPEGPKDEEDVCPEEWMRI